MEIVSPSLKNDLGACFGIYRSKDGTDKSRCAAINLIFDERAGLKNEKITHDTTLDRAAKVIVTMRMFETCAVVTKLVN